MRNLSYTVKLEPAEEGGYVVTVPALPGCFTQGETYDEALAHAEEAILCYIEGLTRRGLPVPQEKTHPARVRININLPVSA